MGAHLLSQNSLDALIKSLRGTDAMGLNVLLDEALVPLGRVIRKTRVVAVLNRHGNHVPDKLYQLHPA